MTAEMGRMDGWEGERMVIYVAGPYTAETPERVARNVRAAELAGQEIMRRGHAALCPHTMTHDWDKGAGLEYQDFIDADLALLGRCDAICMVGNWMTSEGAEGELKAAGRLGLAIFMAVVDVPDLRITKTGNSA